MGRPLALPITLAAGDVIDPAPPRGGLVNVNRRLGFDNAGWPVITYHNYDAAGDLQVSAARREANGWVVVSPFRRFVLGIGSAGDHLLPDLCRGDGTPQVPRLPLC